MEGSGLPSKRTISSCVCIGGAQSIKIEDAHTPIAPVVLLSLVALNHFSARQVAFTNFPLLHATEIAKGYLPKLDVFSISVVLKLLVTKFCVSP